MVRLVIGNPLIMKEMAKQVPLTACICPDRMASFLAPYGNPDALAVAQSLAKKVEDLLRQAAA
jgi:hypothetical protein